MSGSIPEVTRRPGAVARRPAHRRPSRPPRRARRCSHGSLTGNVTARQSGRGRRRRHRPRRQCRHTNVAKATAPPTAAASISSATSPPAASEVSIEAPIPPLRAKGITGPGTNAVRRADVQLDAWARSTDTVTVTRVGDRPADRSRRHPRHADRARRSTTLPADRLGGTQLPEPDTVVPAARSMAGEQNSAARQSAADRFSFNVERHVAAAGTTPRPRRREHPDAPCAADQHRVRARRRSDRRSQHRHQRLQRRAGAWPAAPRINVVIRSGTERVPRRRAGSTTPTRTIQARNFFATTPTEPGRRDLRAMRQQPRRSDRQGSVFFFSNWRAARRGCTARAVSRLQPADGRRFARGDFSGTGVTIYDPARNPDPALRTPFPGSVIPANRIDLAATEMINRMPLRPRRLASSTTITAQGKEEYSATTSTARSPTP